MMLSKPRQGEPVEFRHSSLSTDG